MSHGGLQMTADEVHVVEKHVKSDFEQQLDAARAQSWQGQVEAKQRVEAAHNGGQQPVPVKMEVEPVVDGCVVAIDGLSPESCSQQHLVETCAVIQ
eukprot:SAG31_NODE_4524_length_3165_cov_2.028702_3_plen_96_part_00